MADQLDVLTLQEAKQALNLTQTERHDDELPFYITAVSQTMDRLIGPVVKRTVTNETHDGGRRFIRLQYYPVVTITSLKEYRDTVPTVLLPETPESKPDEAYLTVPYTRNVVADKSLKGALVYRRSSRWHNRDARFECGTGNIVVSYVAGRVDDTASVPRYYKMAASLILANYWRSQQDSTGQVNEFDVPQSYFPRWAIPQAARQMLADELQILRQQLA